MEYIPRQGLFVYFRYNDRQTIMCVMNTASNPARIDFAKYAERTAGFRHATDIVAHESFSTSVPRQIPAMSMWVLELSRE